MYYVEKQFSKTNKRNDKPSVVVGHRAFRSHDAKSYDAMLKEDFGHHWQYIRIWNQAARREERGIPTHWSAVAYNTPRKMIIKRWKKAV